MPPLKETYYKNSLVEPSIIDKKASVDKQMFLIFTLKRSSKVTAEDDFRIVFQENKWGCKETFSIGSARV